MDMQVAPPVLVVDDDEDIREVLHTLLQDEGYAVHETARHCEAIDYLRAATSAHVVLLNHMLRGDDVSLLHAAKEDASLRRHCYVLVTASQIERMSDDERRLIAELCLEVVTKPFDVDVLLSAVTTAAAQVARN